MTKTVIETYSKSSCAFLNDNYTLDLFNKGDERDAIDCLEQEFLAPWQREKKMIITHLTSSTKVTRGTRSIV